MKVKIIAVDLDGTFLNSESKYNVQRFKKIFEEMRSKDIRFVSASGNPLVRMLSYFEDIQDDMTFIAENGCYILENNEEIYTSYLDEELVTLGIEVIKDNGNKPFMLSGNKAAYVYENIDDESYKTLNHYYPILLKTTNFSEVDDNFFNFVAIYNINDQQKHLSNIRTILDGKLVVVPSGASFVDFMKPIDNKGTALKFLQEKFHILPEESAAFGDSQNDIELLEQVHYSFAMENAQESVKRVASEVIGDNNSDSLLDKIEELIR